MRRYAGVTWVKLRSQTGQLLSMIIAPMSRKRYERQMCSAIEPIQVSVVIPAYNAAGSILETLNSVLMQTEQRFEIIVADDFSTDNTAELVAGVAAADTRVRLLRLPANDGPGSARNSAVDAARGVWIALLDADDTYHPQRLERLFDLASRTGADMVSDNITMITLATPGTARTMFSTDRLPGELRLTSAEFYRQNTRTNDGVRDSFGFMQPMIRTDFLRSSGARYLPGSRFGEDFYFYALCLAAHAKWWVTPEPLYRYAIRPGSLTENVCPAELKRISDLERLLIEAGRRDGDAELVDAIRAHRRSVDHWRYTVSFRRALRARTPLAAMRIAFDSGFSFRCTMGECLGWAARSVRRALVQAAAGPSRINSRSRHWSGAEAAPIPLSEPSGPTL